MNWNPDIHYKNQSVAREYDRVRFSSLPGRVFNALEKRTIVKCFATLPVGKTIVDMPCGTGRLADALLSHGYKVHGMDISAEMLAVAQARLKTYGDRFSSEVADAKHLAKDAAGYDGALCARVLMHFPLEQQIEFLTGVGQLSRGRVVINHSLSSPYQRLRRRIKRYLGHQESARHPITNKEIKQLLDGAGLREVRRYRLWSLISEAIYIVAEKAPA
jgi:2-polyprenyl-3-methyl-5-hydroxy-6-metoxy-1,4-benzoquinol methylase